ncbi:MBL fold metallo-hydrolase [Fusibacillus kribbianus]|uniref:MBL fold metallo-hydrolase n=1 Tax=Fusibacillus kribbianus TaxID=3044208 RepID=A0AAP4BBN4_9FIRM|nr:MBL fold metallo-hydrolase [Ruminococcus sp. YH-rum2234]MDI9242897.1 MBL fold metallo-hydrolase [Ruminococcus sp. YH-rum2234]
MEELYVLGTGNAQATRCYNTCFAVRDGDEYFLVDAGGGNGILRILEDMDIPLTSIHHIFVTHEHNDHILGMVWMIRMIATAILKGSYEGNLTIYCHDGLVDTIKTLCTLTIQKKFCKCFDDRILFVPLKDGDTRQILDYEVTFFDILSTKARQFGFTTVLKNGKKLTCAGDEPYNPGCERYVAGSDWLLHEAFCLYEDRDRFKPYEKHHSTVKDACELAESLHIPNLVLWHTEDKDIAHRKERYTKEGKEYYSGQLFVPDDKERLVL